MSDGVYWNFTSTCPHCGGVFSVVAGQQQPHECGDEPSSGDEAGSGFRGVARSGHAATGAGAIAVPPVPVAAQPRYILDKDAILELVQRYGEACKAVTKTYFRDVTDHRAAKADAAYLLDAIRGALTPVPDVEPEPAWGSGPLVKHVTETPGQAVQS